ncbi:carboxymuconolactone decarboxylase family protein [Actinotalea subterranea]|uniref:carboxymuconolactone decarboxylase family protein n=1 Tax=Actinotalea subterranea TaxID=2607497 RepID=UPI001CAA88B7|nr:carboxymuconolactone decarboxylase family protein [Actinotalea subterranea]
MDTMTRYHDRYTALMAGMSALGGAVPGPMAAFGQLHRSAGADGALDGKTKELIALGIAVTVRCEGCIVCHVQDSLTLGATREEIQEVLGVAVLMGGGPSVVYACEALEALDELAPAVSTAAAG